MICPIGLAIEFFEGLAAKDLAITRLAAREPCRHCGGPLYRSDYPRKPRGGVWGALLEAFGRRFSLCCGREGCRHRATPPSLRFLGRRVYVGAVVVVASVVALVATTASEIVRTTGVPARTVRRWLGWWRGAFLATVPFAELSGRLVPAPDRRRVPESLLARMSGEPAERVGELLGWLAPLTTSDPGGSRWMRGVMSPRPG